MTQPHPIANFPPLRLVLSVPGETTCHYDLGSLYEHGRGVPQDYAEAAKWYRLSAEGGYALAQHALARLYAAGEGVEQDFAEAAAWFRKAADQGYARAQYALACAYRRRRGCAPGSR